jgi:hypothetical protein
MAETLETATTTDLSLDDIPLDCEFDRDVDIEWELGSDVDIEWEFNSDIPIEVIVKPIVESDFTFSTFALGAEDGDWACEIYVLVVPYPSPDAETPVVSDPV